MKKNKSLKDCHLDDYVKANRKGSRSAEMENNGKFKSNHKVHKNYKKYSRKNSINSFIFEEE
jgi:hypothetical protein